MKNILAHCFTLWFLSPICFGPVVVKKITVGSGWCRRSVYLMAARKQKHDRGRHQGPSISFKDSVPMTTSSKE